LDYDLAKFEVLVIEDGGDSSEDVIARYRDRLDLRHWRNQHQGPAVARNRALTEATGEYVVFTDDDCAPEPDWLTAYERVFAEHPNEALGGMIVDALENRIYGRASQLLITFLYEHSISTKGSPDFFCSNNMAFPRQALIEIGGFAETFPLAAAEDRDLCARWAQMSTLRFVPSAIIRHSQDLTLRTFWRQHWRYGRGAFQFWQCRQAEGQPGRKLNKLEFYQGMCLYPFSRLPVIQAAAISALFAISQIASAGGYFREKSRRSGND
jgi:GT2 family glycosyltransferase